MGGGVRCCFWEGFDLAYEAMNNMISLLDGFIGNR